MMETNPTKMNNDKDTKAATGLSEALAESIKKFEAFKTDPKYQSEMEQNAVIVTLRELKDLSVYDESIQQEIEQLKGDQEKKYEQGYADGRNGLHNEDLNARVAELEGLLREVTSTRVLHFDENVTHQVEGDLLTRITSALSGTEKQKES